MSKTVKGLSVQRPFIFDYLGRPVSIEQIDSQEAHYSAVLLDPGPGRLRDAAEAEGLLLLPQSSGLMALLRVLADQPNRCIESAALRLVFPEIIESDTLNATQRALLEESQALLNQCTAGLFTNGRLLIQLGDFGGQEAGASHGFSIERHSDSAIYRRPPSSSWTHPWWRLLTELVINRHDSTFQALCVFAIESPQLAAICLTQIVMVRHGFPEGQAHERLLECV